MTDYGEVTEECMGSGCTIEAAVDIHLKVNRQYLQPWGGCSFPSLTDIEMDEASAPEFKNV